MAASSSKTAAEAAMDRQLAAIAPNTPRHLALSAARAFKASWVALGQALQAVQKDQLYLAWGYQQFSRYCREELHVREETARKLTRSYAYLAEHAPAALGREGLTESAPSLDVVDLLRQARGRTNIDEDAWQAVQGQALATADGPMSRSQVLASLRAADPAAFAPGAEGAVDDGRPAASRSPAEDGQASPAEVDPRHARKVLLLAERLGALLREQPALAEADHQEAIESLARSLRRHARIEQAQGREAAPGERDLARGRQGVQQSPPPGVALH